MSISFTIVFPEVRDKQVETEIRESGPAPLGVRNACSYHSGHEVRWEWWHADLGGNWKISCRGSWNLYTWGERKVQPHKEMDAIQRRPRQPVATVIPGKNELFLVIYGFQWCSSLDSPHLPSSPKTRPWVSSKRQLKPLHFSCWTFSLAAAPSDTVQVQNIPRSSVIYPSWKLGQNYSEHSARVSFPTLLIAWKSSHFSSGNISWPNCWGPLAAPGERAGLHQYIWC